MNEEILNQFRELIYNPLGQISASEGDMGFVSKGPQIVADVYAKEPELFATLATKHAEEGYTRKKVICDNGKHAVRCMEWAPDAISAIHEHGGRVCFDIVLEGVLEVIDYRPHAIAGEKELFFLEEVRRYEAHMGEFVIIDPFTNDFEAHTVVNLHTTSKSLHFYPIDHRSMYIYQDLGDNTFSRVEHPLADD